MFRSMLAICKKYWAALTAFLVGGILQLWVGLSAVAYFQRVLDGIASAGEFSDLSGVLLWFAGLTIANHVLIYLGGYPQSILNSGAYLWAKLRAMKKVAGMNFLSYQDLGTGQLVQIIENGATATKNILNGFYLNTLRAFIPQFVIALAFVRYYDRTLFAIMLGAYVVLFLLSNRLMIILRREVDRMLAKQESLSKFSVRGFMELVVFRVNGRFKNELARVRGISDEIVRSRAKIYLVQELFFTGFAVLVFLLETVVGERGVKLSGGERQRLAFARVLVQDPRIVVMDEPTAALDSVAESFVTEHLADFFRDRTVIVIAHRLQTVKGADRIVVLEDGEITQEGGFDSLIATNGRFRQLWEEQTAGRLREDEK